MKFKRFGRPEHRLLSDAIQKAIASVAEEFGVELTAEGGQIGPSGGRVHVNVKITETANGLPAAQNEWNSLCRLYHGLRPDQFGQVFAVDGTLYRVSGLVTSRPKFPVSAIRVHDKRGFKFPASTIARLLPMKAAA